MANIYHVSIVALVGCDTVADNEDDAYEFARQYIEEEMEKTEIGHFLTDGNIAMLIKKGEY